MKPHVALSLVAGLTIAGAAHAQNSQWQEMDLVDIGRAGALPADLNVWDSMLVRNDQKFKADFGAPKTKSGRAPALIRWHAFDLNGARVVVSIFHGLAANCESGANSSTSTQTWATCPARITVIKDGQSKTTQTSACFNGFPLGDTVPAPANEKTLVAIDATSQRVQLKAATGGKDAPGCARSVKIEL
jgi:hypothetical protein